MHLLVTGASGLLGLNLCLLAVEKGVAVTGLVHSHPLNGVPFKQIQVDLTNIKKSLPEIQSIQPDAIIHCAAIADINLAEREPGLARQLNSEVPGILAGAAYRNGIPFIHISTDAVFDGKSGGYSENDPTHPLSVYAQTKLAGEQAVMDANPDALVARVVFYGWSLSGKRSLGEFFFNQLKAGESISGFTDTYFCPLYAEDLSALLLDLLESGESGVFHLVSPEVVSKYDFGVRIALKFGFDESLIMPIASTDVQRSAPRSLNLSLKVDKIQSVLGYTLPSVDEGIQYFYERWQQGYPQRLKSFSTDRC
jgi:dTDP-4-dehydrorhamnose reductase